MPFSGITHTYAPDQGRKSLQIRKTVRTFLVDGGLSGDGVRELLSSRPLSSESDRQALQGIIIRLMRERVDETE